MPRHLHAGRKFALAGVMFAVLTALCLWRFEALA